MADGVEEVRLAAAGAAMEEERVEGDILGRRQGAGGVEGDLIGLADDEGLETITGLERGGIDAIRIFGILRLRFRGRGNFGEDGRPLRLGADADADMPDRGNHRPPGKRESLGEMSLDPVGHELGGELQAHRSASGVEAAERDRTQPAVEGAGAAVATKLGANLLPCRTDRIGNVLLNG